MKKKLFIFIVILILGNSCFTGHYTNSNNQITSYSYIPENNGDSVINDFSDSSTLGNNESLSINIGELTNKHYFVWNMTSSVTNITCMLLDEVNFAKFNLGLECHINVYLIDHLQKPVSILDEACRIPSSANWYIVFWNDNPTTTFVSAGVIAKELLALIIDLTYTCYSSGNSRYLDSVEVVYNINFNFNLEKITYKAGVHDNVTIMLIKDCYGSLLSGSNITSMIVFPDLTEFVFDLGPFFYGTPGSHFIKLRSYYQYPYDPQDSRYIDDSLRVDITEKLYVLHFLEDVNRLLYGIFILGVLPIVIILTPVLVYFISKSVKKKRLSKISTTDQT